MNDVQWTEYGKDEYLQPKSYQVVGDRVKLNWNQNFDMDVYKFAECCNQLQHTPLSHASNVTETTVGAESDNIITMSRTFDSPNTRMEYLTIKSGDVAQNGNQAKFSLDELNTILGTLNQLQ